MSDLRKAAEMALRQLNRDNEYLGHRSKTRADAITALRQAIEQAEKQEPFIYVREDNEKPFGGYEHCSEADSGAFPVYTAPVDAVNISQERVDETVKREHEYVIDCPRCGHCCPERRWVGLTDEDWDEIFGNALTIGEAIKVTEAKLKEKNA